MISVNSVKHRTEDLGHHAAGSVTWHLLLVRRICTNRAGHEVRNERILERQRERGTSTALPHLVSGWRHLDYIFALLVSWYLGGLLRPVQRLSHIDQRLRGHYEWQSEETLGRCFRWMRIQSELDTTGKQEKHLVPCVAGSW